MLLVDALLVSAMCTFILQNFQIFVTSGNTIEIFFLIKLSDPPRSNRFITNTNAATFPFEISTNFAAASAVPPVAIRSSIISILSFSFIESLCTSIVAVPYSNSKSTDCTSAGRLFFFLSMINGFLSTKETAEAKTNPLDSIAAILLKLNFLV